MTNKTSTAPRTRKLALETRTLRHLAVLDLAELAQVAAAGPFIVPPPSRSRGTTVA